MFNYKKCVPHSVLPKVEVCPELVAQVTEFVEREIERVRFSPLGSHFDRGAETILALL